MKIKYYLGLNTKGFKEQTIVDIDDYEANEWLIFGLEQGYKVDSTLSKEKQVQMVIDESFREQYNADRKEFYHTRRFKDFEDDEGNIINGSLLVVDETPNQLDLLIAEEKEQEKKEREQKLLEILTPKQRQRYLKLKEMTIDELAKEEGVGRSSIYDTIEQIKKKLKKF